MAKRICNKCNKCNKLFYSKYILCNLCFQYECDDYKCHAAGVLITTLINNKKYALLGRCSEIKNVHRRGKLEFFGGVAENNEHPKITASRETYEETLGTIKINPDKLKKINYFKNAYGNGYILYEYEIPYAEALNAIIEFNKKFMLEESPVEVDKLMIIDIESNRKKLSNFATILI